ncbi:hypothetical protein MBSD_n2681 [Mizugakiibacter sediminis]|uniref:Uncharacterized protein n=1 Tax=Mizugakiibacter sediminis TaxID=1475481 RepID=A0A0K8QR46_9GAMM|nr:hypothetical protein [Mizugakiibacter sediminis]GAP67360.1 hypothetical protein MBSD_n2681 [Mizugakiibacter sediminis]
MSDAQFISGLIVKAPHERAPEYVKAKLSIKREELIAWLQGQAGEWINADVKVSAGGKWYAVVDMWKPDNAKQAPREKRKSTPAGRDVPPPDDDLPF